MSKQTIMDGKMKQEEDKALFYQAFQAFIRDNRVLKDTRDVVEGENDSKYVSGEVVITPVTTKTEITFNLGGATWSMIHSRKGTSMELSVSLHKHSNLKPDITEVLVSAIHPTDPSRVLLFSSSVPNHGIVRCDNPFASDYKADKTQGGIVRLRIHMQLFPTVHLIYSFQREFRLQLYWIKKKKIDAKFSDELEATVIWYKKNASNSRWNSYLEIASVDFKMDKNSFWQGLLKHFNGDFLMVDVVYSGLLAQPSGVPMLIEGGEKDFHLMGASLDSVLQKALQLKLSVVQQLDARELTIQHVLEYEKSLCRNGYIVFQFYFLKTILDTSFRKHCRQHRRPDTTLHPASNPNIPGDGEGGGVSIHLEEELNNSLNSNEEKAVADRANSSGDGSEEVVVGADRADSLGDGSEENSKDYAELVNSMAEIEVIHATAIQAIENVGSNFKLGMTTAFQKHPTQKYSPRLQMEISNLYAYAQQFAFDQFINVGEEGSEENSDYAELVNSMAEIEAIKTTALQAIKNIGSNFRVGMTTAFQKHPTQMYSPRLQMEISKLYDYAQQFASDQFINVSEEGSKLANYNSDTQKRNFAGPSTAKGEKVKKTKLQAKEIAELGEKHAWEYYKKKYNNYRVRWMNVPEDPGHPYDICVYDKAGLPMIFIEVKSTIVWGKPWFFISQREYECACVFKEDYIIAQVYVDEKGGPFSLTEFIDPTNSKGKLGLTMSRIK